jgi:hypothetical protein
MFAWFWYLAHWLLPPAAYCRVLIWYVRWLARQAHGAQVLWDLCQDEIAVPPRWAYRRVYVREALLVLAWGDVYRRPDARWHILPRCDPRGVRRMRGDKTYNAAPGAALTRRMKCEK